MKLPKKVVETVEVEYVEVHCKVSDSGCYTLKDKGGNTIGSSREDYVPSFFPDQHYGDYLILNINLETGQIMNWKRPNEEEVARAFGLIEAEE